MPLVWTASAERDLKRLHAFLAPVNPRAAAQLARHLVNGAAQLATYPELGPPLDEFAPRDVRQLIIGEYEMRYELTDTTIYILRIWHQREDR